MATKAGGARRAIYGVGRNRGVAVATIMEAAVKIVRTAHDLKVIGLNDSSCKPGVPELNISIGAPFYLRLSDEAESHYLRELLRSDLIKLPMQLDVWTPEKKVLNVEYDGSYFDIVSFRRGLWENFLISAAERAPIPIAIKSRYPPIIKSPATECSGQFRIVTTEELWARLRNIA
jgi:hypothetical protein